MSTSIDDLIANLEDSAARVSTAAHAVVCEYQARLDALPSPEAPLAALLAELAAVEDDVAAHLRHDWRVPVHQHATCAPDEAQRCPRCQSWTRICRRRDEAIAAVTRYALALRAKAVSA